MLNRDLRADGVRLVERLPLGSRYVAVTVASDAFGLAISTNRSK